MSDRRPLTRGPLPPEVYWRRRFFVVTLALTLVFVIGSVLSGGGDGVDDGSSAQQVAVADPTRTVTVAPQSAAEDRQRKRRGAGRKAGAGASPRAVETTPLADPEGSCTAADIVLTPVVENAVAGQDVTVGLSLQTRESAACTWRVSKRTATLKILDGSTEVWSSRECPGEMPDEAVVVRQAVATVVEMTWPEARESDTTCSNQRGWAMPGDYTVIGSALGGEPESSTFDLATPTARTVTVAPKSAEATTDPDAEKKAEKKAEKRARKKASEQASGQTSPKPSRQPTR